MTVGRTVTLRRLLEGATMQTSRRSLRAGSPGARRWGGVRALPVVLLAAFSVPAALIASGGLAGGVGGGTFTASLDGTQEVPPNASTATGTATVTLNSVETMITVNVTFTGLIGGTASSAHIHGPAAPGTNAPVVIALTGFPAATSGTYSQSFAITSAQVSNLRAGLFYVDIHDATFPGGEIRGQLTEVVPPTTTTTTTNATAPPAGAVQTAPRFTG
jgi:hypothetical protein